VHQPLNFKNLNIKQCTYKVTNENKVPFENLIEPFDDDDRSKHLDAERPPQSKGDREIYSEHIFRIEYFRDVHKEALAIGKTKI
jgi:hypothetical protein